MKLETLLEKITPLLPLTVGPQIEGLPLHNVRDAKGHRMALEIGTDEALYLAHASNSFPTLLEALENCCQELDRLKLNQDGFTEEQLTDHALVDMTAHDAACQTLTQAREVRDLIMDCRACN